ncbi:MAG: LpxI family protein [Candidatus Omnitrophica bacterium]|nr:LpxI family protein [Candidatus Omnitrophota bacterium]
MDKTLGLIAGRGTLPELVLEEARRLRYRIAVCAIQGETNPAVAQAADAALWIRLGQLGRMTQFFVREGAREAMMVGKITKTNLFHGDIRPDLEMVKVVAKTRNHSDDSLLGGIADYLHGKGISVLDSTSFLSEDVLPAGGVLTKRKPSKKEYADIDFGWELAKEIGRLDIGQTVVVKNQAVLAVEAIEGTDEAILRGGVLGNGETVVVKVAKPKQDMRFDVPTIGPATLDAMIRAKARVLAFEAKKTIVLNRNQVVDRANRHRIAMIAKEF